MSQNLATALQPGDRVRVCLKKKNSRMKTDGTEDPLQSGGTIPNTINPSVPRPLQTQLQKRQKVLKATEEGGKKEEHVDNCFPTSSNRRQWSKRK